MNDMPISHGALPHRPDPVGSGCRYHDARTTGMPQAHQQQVMTLNRPKHGMTRTGTSPPPLKPPGPMLTTKDLPIRDRSLSSSGSSSPNKSAHGDIRWCVCQPARKIPRPRNGESMISAQSSSEHGKCFLISKLVAWTCLGRYWTNDVTSFYSVPSALPGSCCASESWNGEPGDLQDYWRPVEVSHGG